MTDQSGYNIINIEKKIFPLIRSGEVEKVVATVAYFEFTGRLPDGEGLFFLPVKLKGVVVMEEKPNKRLIVALDTSEEFQVRELVARLEERVDIFKVGLEQYLASCGKVVDFLRSRGKGVFLDLKFHDIPNTMAAAARRAVAEGVWMFNVHVTGREAMQWVVEAAADEAAKRGMAKPLVTGVTVLTSLADQDLYELGTNLSAEELVIKRAILSREVGLDGVVASAREAGKIKESCGCDFITVCPGIRPVWSVKGDQKRVLPPAKALNNGADYLVVGRAITEAEQPEQAVELIIREMEGVLVVKQG